MATTITVFDPTQTKSKTITVAMEGTVFVQDLDTDVDYYFILSTAAKMKNGNSIPSHIIKSLNSGAGTGGSTQHDGTALPYSSMNASIRDHVRRMVEGTPGQPTTAMDFGS